MAEPKTLLDFSTGDPLLPLTRIANIAFRHSRQEVQNYWLNTSRADNRSIGPILRDLTDCFTERGFKATGWTGIPTHGILLTGGGTTEGYELVIRALAEDVKDYNRQAGRAIKPVIIMPVPTYGFFFRNPEDWGIEIVKVERDLAKGGHLDPWLVHKTLEGLATIGAPLHFTTAIRTIRWDSCAAAGKPKPCIACSIITTVASPTAMKPFIRTAA